MNTTCNNILCPKKGECDRYNQENADSKHYHFTHISGQFACEDFLYKVPTLKERIAKLDDVYDFTQNISALTEMKEVDHNSNPNLDLIISMAEIWDCITECAMEFAELHENTEWDGDWYEALEVYYRETVRIKIFVV